MHSIVLANYRVAFVINSNVMELIKLLTTTNTASTLLYLSIVGVGGILIGKIRFLKIKLGIAGVLFAGLIAGHLGANVNSHVLHFTKEIGLILFVYSIGIEIGPRFISSFLNNGLKLNAIAASIIIGGFLIAIAIKFVFNLDTHIIAGIMCGSVTNTPSLGAAQLLISEQSMNGSELAQQTGMAYAIAYPFGIIGIILVMFLVKKIFKIDVQSENKLYRSNLEKSSGKSENIHISVNNQNLFGKPLSFIKQTIDKNFVFSAMSRKGEFITPDDNTIIEKDDILYGIAREEDFQTLELTVGQITKNEKFKLPQELSMRHIVVTNKKITKRRIKDLNFSGLFPANITRIFRAQTEIIPNGDTTLEFGDTVRVVGARNRMTEINNFLGNSLQQLSHPNLLPIFVGITLGVFVGCIPFFIPGLPAPAKLGLAGGPLIIALILGHKGRIGSFDFYITPSANLFIREFGITLFLACVGLGAGKHFWSTLINGGYMWMLYGALITFIPLMIAGVVARKLKTNYLSICGLLAGSMTDPPALEFANSIAKTQAQASSYATVYPLTMFLRILLAQILILILS